MYCSRCGTQNKDTAKFCDSCGLDLTATTPVGALSEAQEITEIEMVRLYRNNAFTYNSPP